MSAGRGAPPHILAIDMGTGTAKAALVSRGGQIAAAAIREIEMLQLPGGGAEQSPDQWWEAVTAAAREALERSGLGAEDVVAVRCATQWAVTVPVDAEGRALANAISWMDTRGGPHVAKLVGGPVKVSGYSVTKLPRWIRLTGGAPVLSGIDGLGHLLYFKNERPDVYEKTAAFLEPMDYLNLRLCGRCAASGATIYPYWLTDNRNVGRVRYDARLLRRAGIDAAKLPELVPVDAILGTVTPEACEKIGLQPQTPVLSGLPDSQAATIGAGIAAYGQGYMSIGTSSWLSCLVPSKKTDLMHMIATSPAALPGHHQVVAEQGAAGRCLEFVARNILYGTDADGAAPPPNLYEVLDRQAAAIPPGSDGLIFTPWLNGVNAPHEDPSTRSAFFNQSLATIRAHYVRATMEGVAYNLRWLKRAVERFVHHRFDHLNLIGGAALSTTWCQILADVLDCSVGQVSNPRYANAVGAALSGFVALGELEPQEIATAVELTATFEPDAAARRVHDRQFEYFLGHYKANRRLYRRLNA